LAGDAWWAGLPGATLTPVLYAGSPVNGTLRLAADGPNWKGQRSYVRVPWAAIANIETGQISIRRGKQSSAIGIGPIGLAFVALTAISNASAATVHTYNGLEFTTRDGKKHGFLSKKSFAPFSPMCQAFQKFRASQPSLRNESLAVPNAALGVADEIAKLEGLRSRGIVSDTEFASQKAKLLGS
jgi:hypothetical protein